MWTYSGDRVQLVLVISTRTKEATTKRWELTAMKQNTEAYSLPGVSLNSENKTTRTYFPMKRPKQQSNVL